MEWFNITWIFGIITLACAGFFLQMVVAYNVVRSQIIPALNQVREIRKRHGVEIEKVDRLTKEAETQLAELEVEAQGLGEQIKDLDEKLEAYKDDDSEER